MILNSVLAAFFARSRFPGKPLAVATTETNPKIRDPNFHETSFLLLGFVSLALSLAQL